MIEGYVQYFLKKIYLRVTDTGIQLVKIFKKPDAGAAVNLWNIESGFTNIFILEIQELFNR